MVINFGAKHKTTALTRTFQIMLLVALMCLGQAKAYSQPPWESDLSRPEDLQFEIFTFGPGPSLEEWWGHIALHVQDTRLRYNTLYNWGMFSFDERLFVNFIKGRLRFWAAAEPVSPSVAFYRRQGRIIHAIPLNLSSPQKRHLIKLVSQNMLLENREYDYEYLRDNCSTRIRDHLNAVTNGALENAAKSKAGKGSFRTLINTITAKNYPMNLLINFLLGPSVDLPNTRWDDMFLPSELESFLAQHEVFNPEKNENLTNPIKIIHQGTLEYPKQPLSAFPLDIIASLGFGILAIAAAILSKKFHRAFATVVTVQTIIAGTILGACGSFLLFFNLFTWHTYTFWNENLFFGNPFSLIIALISVFSFRSSNPKRVLWILKTTAALSSLAICGILIKTLQISHQDNWTFVRSIPTILICLTIAWNIIYRSSGSTTRKNVS